MARGSKRQLCLFTLLGLAHMLMYVGYDTGNFITESALHSVHVREPTRMRAHDGYYGQAISNIFYMFGNILSPLSVRLFRSTRVMAVSSALFSLYAASFLFLNTYLFYAASALQGFMLAMFNAGYSLYVTEISTRDWLERNSSLELAIISLSTFIGGVIYIVISMLLPTTFQDDGELHFRAYSEEQIQMLYGTFACTGILSAFIMALLPQQPFANSMAASVQRQLSGRMSLTGKFAKEIKRTLLSFYDWRVLQLAPYFCYVGASVAFWSSVFPTAMQFTQSLAASSPFLTAYYAISVCVGSLSAGFVIGPLSSRFNNFGLTPLISIAMILQTILSVLMLLCMPEWSTSRPTAEPSLLIQPTIFLVLGLAVGFGALEVCNLTSRTVVCTLVRPEKRAYVFAVARFYQAVASCLLFFTASLISTYTCIGVILFFCYFGGFLAIRLSRKLKDSSSDINESTNDQSSDSTQCPSLEETSQSTVSSTAKIHHIMKESLKE